MLIYRFRITSADQEDFVREIEIQPTQTFLDFHEIILSCSDLDSCQNAVFFNTDKKYKPHSEISLKPQKKQLKKYDEELDEIITVVKTPPLMKDAQLKSFIEDPHQKMIYEFTGKDFFVFHIELFKIMKTEETYLLPRCTRKTGVLPKRLEVPIASAEDEAEVDAIGKLTATLPLMAGVFDGLHEDEHELAEIENNLEEFLEMEEEEGASPATELNDGDSFHMEEDERMESLEDFEDIENLELKHRSFDRDSDEF